MNRMVWGQRTKDHGRDCFKVTDMWVIGNHSLNIEDGFNYNIIFEVNVNSGLHLKPK